MASFKVSASSSSSKPTGGWVYDVFPSFRGEDTRNGFVDHLYDALVEKGIHTFKDDAMLHLGTPISQELLKAIEESRFAVVVFSKNYANSSWCLDELAKIMESQNRIGQKVLPVFYHIDSSDVRGQKGDFATAFEQHEEKFNGEMHKVNRWRKALTAAANISGLHISAVSGGEAASINRIIEVIFGYVQPRGWKDDLIGIESCIDSLNLLLSMEDIEEVRTIGIVGMGGIGKTTIAHALFQRIAYKFEGSCFAKNVRENSSTEKDICALQEKFLKDVLETRHNFMIQDPDYGANIIRERFCNKKVLLVLDDVDDVKQLEFLAATNEWFGDGSRIIVTTRDEHVLSNANTKYKPALLLMDQAIELFSRYAFGKSRPPNEFKELSDRAIGYTGGLPLALKVLGSFLRGRKASVWESTLDKLAEKPNSDIYEILKLSFDGLELLEKEIFLDTACFYNGKEIKDVTKMLDSFGLHEGIGIDFFLKNRL